MYKKKHIHEGEKLVEEKGYKFKHTCENNHETLKSKEL